MWRLPSSALLAAGLGLLPPALAAQSAPGAPKTTGTYGALVLFAKFAGEAPGDDARPSWAADLFDPAVPGSFAHFYHEMSEGRLRVDGQVLPRRYASRLPAAAYVAPTPGTLGDFGRFNLEILQQADADADFGRFDNDGLDGAPNSGDDDGYVDVVFINLLTVPRDFFIGGATGFASTGLKTDFLSADAAAGGGPIKVRSPFSGFGGTTQRGHTFSVTAATMCHEFGHVLGLPDLFDQSSVTASGQLDPAEDGAGIGKWCLMGLGTLGWGVEDGPNALCAWSRARLGWLGPANERLVEVTASRRGLVLEPIDRGGDVLKVSLTPDEYFLVENRQATGSFYDRNIPGGGLLVWHVDERADNDEERHKQVDLVCADGLWAGRGFPGDAADPEAGGDNLDFWARDGAYATAHNGNQGDATDPFDGVTYRRFGHDTNPGARGYSGARRDVPLGFALDNITALGDGRMGLDLLLGQPVAGNVSGEVAWSGEVSLEGDAVVEPGATLTLAAGTRVGFAAADGRAAGFDSARCELIVYGELLVRGTAQEPVRLGSAGSPWLGVALPGGTSPQLEAAQAAGALVISGALLGIARGRLPAGSTVWSGARSVPWDLVVPAGSLLAVEGGSHVRFAAQDLSFRGAAPGSVELVVEGELRVRGSAAAPATFTVDSADLDDLWHGVRLVGGGTLDVEGLTLTQAVGAVTGDVAPPGALRLADSRLARTVSGVWLTLFGDATLRRTTLQTVSTQAVRVEGFGTLHLEGCRVEGNGREGVWVSNAGLVATDTRIAGNGILDGDDPRSGLFAEGGAGQRIELWDSAVEGNRKGGLDLDGWAGIAELHGSSVSANRGDGLVAGGAERVVLEDVEVARNLGTGVRLGATTAEVSTTHFDDNVEGGLLLERGARAAVEGSRFTGNGLVLDGAAATRVRTTTFQNAALALRSTDSAPEVVANRFEGNTTALRVEGTPVPAAIRGNVFSGNRTAIDNRSGTALAAPGNYWGTADSAAIAGLFQGAVEWAPFLDKEPALTAVKDEEEGAVPRDFALRGNWPNPFNGYTVIGFDLPQPAAVDLVVYDLLGQPVRRLARGAALAAGRYEVAWDGTDDGGYAAASGVYLYRLRAGRFAATGRMALVR